MTYRQIRSLASCYDFTYDTPFWYDSDRQSLNFGNRAAMSLLAMAGINYNVALAISNMSEVFIADLVEELLAINPSNVSLLQLMPLGRNQESFYNGNLVADKIITLLHQQDFAGTVRKNCAMIGCCNGFSEQKLGLDENGDLYWCIWAADLPAKKHYNPFYLGNVLEQPLEKILQKNHHRSTQIPRHYCHVLHYLKETLV